MVDPIGISAHELDARAEGVLKVCDQFTSVSTLKDFIRSCLRAEAIKSVAARGDKIGYAHGQANLAARFMAEDSKPTPTPAKTYLTAAADLPINIDEKKEQKEHIALLLSFYETHNDDGDRGRKGGRGDGGRGRGRGRGSGRGGNGGGDGAAPRREQHHRHRRSRGELACLQTPGLLVCRPLARLLLAAMMLRLLIFPLVFQ